MINNLVKKRQIVSQEEELQRIKITLQQNELALLRLAKNLEFQYQNKYSNMWTYLKKKRSFKEVKTLKQEFDAFARVQARQTRASVQQKTKRYISTATKSLEGLVRVADTVGIAVPVIEEKFETDLREFKFSIATPQKMFDKIASFETIQTNISGLLQIVEACQKEVLRQEEAVKRNMYFNSNYAKKNNLNKIQNREIEK